MILIHVSFSFPAEMMGDVLTKQAKDLAESINLEPGFISKIWTENSDTKKAGGVYLFKDIDTAEKYIAMHSERLKNMGVQTVNAEYFQVNEALSKINKGI